MGLTQDGDKVRRIYVTDIITAKNFTVTDTFTYANLAVGQLACTTAPVSYLLPSIGVGVYGTPVVDVAVIDNIAFTVNMSTATNKTDADTSSMAAFIGNKNTAHVTHTKMQGILSSMTIGFDCFDAYAFQGTIAITGTMATHDGNANLVAGAFKSSIKNTFTATGNVSSLYVVTGDTGATTGSVATGTFDALRFENNATNLNSYLNFGGVSGATYLATMGLGGCVTASATALNGVTTSHKLAIYLNGALRYIPVVTTGMA